MYDISQLSLDELRLANSVYGLRSLFTLNPILAGGVFTLTQIVPNKSKEAKLMLSISASYDTAGAFPATALMAYADSAKPEVAHIVNLLLGQFEILLLPGKTLYAGYVTAPAFRIAVTSLAYMGKKNGTFLPELKK